MHQRRFYSDEIDLLARCRPGRVALLACFFPPAVILVVIAVTGLTELRLPFRASARLLITIVVIVCAVLLWNVLRKVRLLLHAREIIGQDLREGVAHEARGAFDRETRAGRRRLHLLRQGPLELVVQDELWQHLPDGPLRVAYAPRSEIVVSIQRCRDRDKFSQD